MLGTAASAEARPSPLDPTFGTGGVVRTTFPNTYAYAAAAVIQPNGSILVVGSTAAGHSVAVLVRYRPNGSLDPSFGKGGIVTTSYGNGFSGEAIALQRDGKIVIAGVSFDASSNTHPTAARYEPNGSLDNGFGAGGVAQAPLAAGRDASAVLVQPNGKIVIGTLAPGIGVTRFAANGKSLDPSFDGDGFARVPGDEGGCGASSQSGTNGLTLTSTGAIIASGVCGGGSTSDPEPAAGLVRFRGATTANDAALDTTFGAGGAALSPFARPNFSEGFARLADGRLLQADQIGFASHARIGLFRKRPTGAVDSAFGTGGSVNFQLSGFPSSAPAGLALAPNGGIVIGASDGQDDGSFALVRRTATGAPDRHYRSHGQASVKVGPPGNGFMSSGATALVLQRDDRPIVVGVSYKNTHSAFTLVRFRAPTDRVTRLRLKPVSIVPAPRGPSVKATTSKKQQVFGGVVTYIGSEPATTTTFTVQRRVAGRVVGGRCVTPSAKNSQHKHCPRYTSVGKFKHADTVGTNRFRFTGRVHHQKLSPGHYRLRAIPRNSGGLGAPAYAGFGVRSG